MILDNTANSLHQDFACGHKDWSSRFMAIPQMDQTKENEQMAEILNLIPTDDPCDESKMSALVNNEDTAIFLGLDASGKSILLLHNLEVLPSSRLQKKPNIRVLHRPHMVHHSCYQATSCPHQCQRDRLAKSRCGCWAAILEIEFVVAHSWVVVIDQVDAPPPNREVAKGLVGGNIYIDTSTRRQAGRVR
jgi:hypothetical protein